MPQLLGPRREVLVGEILELWLEGIHQADVFLESLAPAALSERAEGVDDGQCRLLSRLSVFAERGWEARTGADRSFRAPVIRL